MSRSLSDKARSVDFKKVSGLSLTVRYGDIVTIGEDIQVQIVANYQGYARLNISAPKQIPIHKIKVDEQN